MAYWALTGFQLSYDVFLRFFVLLVLESLSPYLSSRDADALTPYYLCDFERMSGYLPPHWNRFVFGSL